MPELEALDKSLLNLIQSDFPLVERPYAALAERVGADEQQVMERIDALKRGRIIRQINAIFDTRALGYQSSLVAARYAPEQLHQGALIVNQHPGVSHNYERDHAFNLWYTVAVPPGSDLQAHIDTLHRLSGAEATRTLQTLRLFKIGVDLDMAGQRALDARGTPEYTDEMRRQAQTIPLTAADIALIRELQEDLPVEPAPFAGMAARLGTTPDGLFAHAARLQASGHLRRYAAILYHRKAGYRANGMAVWKVPVDDVPVIGPKMASFRAVSHCYQRPVYPDWPYNLFTMIHAHTPEECQAIIDAIQAETGVQEYAVLYSTTEYRKVRVRYFSDEFVRWEVEHLGATAQTTWAHLTLTPSGAS
jgi:DNA-binding Lrp family transcriptional regulator